MARSKRKRDEPRPVPERTQPEREGKRTTEYTLADFGGSDVVQPPDRAPQVFETSATKRQPVGGMESFGAERRSLAQLAAKQTVVVDNGTPPASISFGPDEGAGAGWYDERQQIYGCGVGTVDWVAVEEIAPVAKRKRSELSRDGEQYLTVVETHASEVNRIFGMTRANTSNIVQYYVNGTMITGYGMDPNGHIESYLMNADIWWRCVGWLGRINAHAYEEPALVFPCPNLMTKRQLTAVPPHRSGIFVAGEIEVDPDTLKLLGPNAVRKWERDSPMPLTIPDDHKQFMTTLSPPAYNAFARPQVLKMQCIWKALIVKLAPNRVVIVDPKSMKDGRCTLWHLPKDLTRIESIASEQQQPRERRAYGWLRHEVIEESRGHTIKIPDMSKAEEVIVCVPPMRKFVQHEGLPIFLVQRTLGRDGLEVRQRATEYDCCVSLRRDYFSRKTLNEGVFQRRMNESLGAQLKEAKGGKVRIIHKAFVPINQFMAFCALLECETGDGANELELNYSDRDLKEQAKLLVRMYGTRIFKLTGIGSNRIDKYHVIMPSTCKLVYNVETQMVSQRLGIYTTSSTFTPMGGQIMDPCPEPEKIMQYHFSLESVKWKRGPNRDRPSVVDKNVRVLTYESTEEHFGMNGTEL